MRLQRIRPRPRGPWLFGSNGCFPIRWGPLLAIGVLSFAQPAQGRITRTRRTPSETWNPFAPFIIGGGVEFERDSEQRQYDFPFLIEYNVSEQLKFSIEPNLVYIEGKTSDVNTVFGFGDLETSVEYEFIPERRYRPALTAEGVIKWPTSTDEDIGDPGTDYSLGLIASKELVFVDLDFNALYTVVGDPDLRDTFETSLAAEWHLSRRVDLIAEFVHAIGTGGIRGRPGSISGVGAPDSSGNETEGTLGFAWHANKFLKLESGVVLKTGGVWQAVLAWEYSFGGD